MLLRNKFLKFIGAGGVNTLLSYLMYVLLLQYFDYQISYALAFLFGIFLAFWLNTQYVFQSKRTVKKFVIFPLVYVIQYVAGALLLGIVVEYLAIDKTCGPIIVTVILLPITYLMSKKVLISRSDR